MPLTVTLGLDKQTKMVTVCVGTIELSTLVTAKSAYLSAFKYFVIANSIAAVFAAKFLILSLASKGKKVAGIAAALDIIIVALLYSAIRAAARSWYAWVSGERSPALDESVQCV
ncbi:CASP-like protein [Drosera capensis]